jgi:putative ABC transport system substrate-binding protein
MIGRRAFLALLLGVVSMSPGVEAQQAKKVYRVGAVAQVPSRVPLVGVLSVGPSTIPLAALGREAFERGLRELGWTPGQTIRIDYRYAESKPERLDELAADLVRLRVDVIVARATPSIRAAKQTTTTIPIVMSASGHDPVLLGFVASFARPGGNITGLTLLNQDLPAKQLQLLKEAVPRVSRVTVLGSRAFPLPPKGHQDLQAAAKLLGLELQHIDFAAAYDLDETFAAMVRTGVEGLLARSDPYILEPSTRQVVGLALKHRLPAIYWLDTYPQAGGLMSYGADIFEVHRRSAFYVDRILRGARPVDLPVEEPSKFALVVNLKTARAIGLKLPLAIGTCRRDHSVRIGSPIMIVIRDLGDHISWPPTSRPALTAWLAQLFVKPTRQRAGVGAALVRAILDRARQCGYPRAYPYTSGTLPESLRPKHVQNDEGLAALTANPLALLVAGAGFESATFGL